ncbi:MAG: hypothetical protein WA981_09490 [Glaciecola sp.]
MKFVLMIVLSSLLLACSKNNDEVVRAGKYGMMSSGTPQYTAVLFMRAVYNEKTLTKAVSMSTPRFGRILKGYHTPKSVQRQVFNLRLDTMTTEPVSGGSMIFTELQEEAEIEMKIIGTYNRNKITELKTLSMVKVSGDWKVNKVSNTVP